MTTRPSTTLSLKRIFQQKVHQSTYTIGTIRVVRKRHGHVTIQEREQCRRIGRVLGPFADAERGTVRVEVVGEVDDGVADFVGGVGGVATVVLHTQREVGQILGR